MSTSTAINSISKWIATGLGVGYIRPAPGTWGSALAMILVYFTSAHYLITIALTILAYITIYVYEKNHEHDDPTVVIDEIAGIYLSFLFLPLTLPILTAGFLLFRFYDILKPFPISWVDKNTPGAFGSLLDDMLAGALTAATIHLIVHLGWLS
ncbi:MAG: phosphatidylglycerophosphatase A [Bdellovibrionales bacterium]|nr:phosphatidylglycerophosphatase A [Bdellovibrionales bacterium]